MKAAKMRSFIEVFILRLLIIYLTTYKYTKIKLFHSLSNHLPRYSSLPSPRTSIEVAGLVGEVREFHIQELEGILGAFFLFLYICDSKPRL